MDAGRKTMFTSRTPKGSLSARKAQAARTKSMITFAGPTRPILTKRDLKQLLFDKE